MSAGHGAAAVSQEQIGERGQPRALRLSFPVAVCVGYVLWHVSQMLLLLGDLKKSHVEMGAAPASAGEHPPP